MPVTGKPEHKWALLGASRGLGYCFYQYLKSVEPQSSVLLLSRKSPELLDHSDLHCSFDFSKESQWEDVLKKTQDASKIIYFAAGGPYGLFQGKSWDSHFWSYKVSFLFPSYLLWGLLKNTNSQQICLIGSSIAESKADPLAASYAASKHALMGLVKSLRGELQQQESSSKDLRLFSPGYMDTSLLPQHAWPRQEGKAAKPNDVAQALYNWLLTDSDDTSGHLVF